jgi:hypothetical protein
MLIVTAIVANGRRSAGRRLFHRAHSPVSALATVVTVAVPVGISPRRARALGKGQSCRRERRAWFPLRPLPACPAPLAQQGVGMTPRSTYGSTDLNIPISMGIPAITIGRGPGGRAHSLDEHTTVERGAAAQSVKVPKTILLASAGGR